jgi:hypothetical protein
MMKKDSVKKSKPRATGLSILIPPALYLLVLGLCACAGSPGVAQNNSGAGYGPAVRLADLENQAINESSGVAASRRNAGLLWTHNDSGGEPVVYAFDLKGRDRGAWRVEGARAQDWEDMAIGPGPKEGQSYIYAGDIGDNSRARDEIIVYRVIEPAVDGDARPSTGDKVKETQPAAVIRLKYPDGKHDAETLMVHPSTGDLYIVTKVRGAAAGVYKLRAPFEGQGVKTLARVGEIEFPSFLRGFVTGGDISPDGRRVVLCDYLSACELALPEKSGVGFDEIWKQTPAVVNPGSRRQGEAICYRADGRALFATSEGVPCPLIEIPLK